MINLEDSQKHQAAAEQVHEVAKNLLRPISRKYDTAGARVPVELKMLAARPTASPSPASGERRAAPPARSAATPSARRRQVQNGANMATVISVMQMCWGDVGLMLSMPGAGLGNAAIDAVATPSRRSASAASARRWRSPSRPPARTRPRSARPPRSTATSGCSTARRSSSPPATAATRSWCGRRSTRTTGKAAIKSFVVLKGTPGMEVELEHKLGIRASDTATILLHRLPHPEGQPARQPGGQTTSAGVRQGDADLRQHASAVAAMAVGCARAALDLHARAAREGRRRRSTTTGRSGQSAAAAELVRWRRTTRRAYLLVLRAAWMADNGEPNSLEARMSKAKAGRVGNDVTLRCVELCGSLGYSERSCSRSGRATRRSSTSSRARSRSSS